MFFCCHFLGRHHNAAVRFCTCESEASTLLRYRLWTSSKNPRRAVHLDLLNLIHYSIMENKTSLHSLCQMLRWKNGLSSSQVCSLYLELFCLMYSFLNNFMLTELLITTYTYLPAPSPLVREELIIAQYTKRYEV